MSFDGNNLLEILKMAIFLMNIFMLLFLPFLFCDKIDDIWKTVSTSKNKIQIVNDLMSSLALNENASETTYSQIRVIIYFFKKKIAEDCFFYQRNFQSF